MRTAAQRIAKYNARMVSSQLDPVRAALVAQQQANYAGYASDFVPHQQALRVLLNGYGIDPAQFIFYEAYAGELYHVYKTTAGASAVAAAVAIAGRWHHASRLGVGPVVAQRLQQIALTLFNIIVP